jgi:hypothetical protein
MKSNPYRSVTHALFVLPFISAIVGIVMVVTHYSSALLLAGAFAALTARAFGRMPLWTLIPLAGLCALAIFVQDAALPDYNFYTDTPEDTARSANTLWRNIRLDGYFLPCLIGSWLMLFRQETTAVADRPELGSEF